MVLRKYRLIWWPSTHRPELVSYILKQTVCRRRPIRIFMSTTPTQVQVRMQPMQRTDHVMCGLIVMLVFTTYYKIQQDL